MIECGFDYKTIIRKLAGYNIGIDQIKAVVVSHKHKDHAMAIEDMDCLQIPVIAPYRGDEVKAYKLTDWLKVRPFAVVHDADCYGFVFLTSDNENLLFLTDTRYLEDCQYFKYKYNYIMIECNHIRRQLEAIMNKAVMDGNQQKVYKLTRQAKFHLSLAGVKKTLNDMDLSETRAIFLMHLSKECCNDDLIKREIREKYHIPTLVCYK